VLANRLASIQDNYALFASTWNEPPPDLPDVAEREALETGEILLSICGSIKLTRFEFFTADFDTDVLTRVCQLSIVLNQSIAQLLVYTTRLPATPRTITFIQSTGAVDSDLVPELMAVLSLIQQVLKSGDPLPPVLPTPLFARSIRLARHAVQHGSKSESGNGDGGSTRGLFVRQSLGDEELRKCVAVMIAVVQFLGALDALVLVLKSAVGETSDIDVLSWTEKKA
jgi:hypothetical protein